MLNSLMFTQHAGSSHSAAAPFRMHSVRHNNSETVERSDKVVGRPYVQSAFLMQTALLSLLPAVRERIPWAAA